MRRIILLLCLLFPLIFVNGENNTPAGTSNHSFLAATTTSDGNIVLAGYSSGPTFGGNYGLVKLTNSGEIMWRHFLSSDVIFGKLSLIETSNHELVSVYATTDGYANFVRLDKDGIVLWSEKFACVFSQFTSLFSIHVAELSTGNLATLATCTDPDAFYQYGTVSVFDGTDGSPLWTTNITAPNGYRGESLVVGNDRIAIMGYDSYSPFDIRADFWVLSYNFEGALQFNTTLNLGWKTPTAAMTLTADNGYLIAGAHNYNTEVDINTWKIDANGNELWKFDDKDEQYFDNGGIEHVAAITTLSSDTFMIAGSYELEEGSPSMFSLAQIGEQSINMHMTYQNSGELIGFTGGSSTGYYMYGHNTTDPVNPALVIMTDSNGNFAWSVDLTDFDEDYVNDIATDDTGNHSDEGESSIMSLTSLILGMVVWIRYRSRHSK